MTAGKGKVTFNDKYRMNKTAQNAMQQIHDRNYALKFRNRGKRIMLIGANLDFDKGQIIDWITEEYCS